MGYCIHQRDGNVFIARENLPKVHAAIAGLMTRAGLQPNGAFRWVTTGAVSSARTVHEQLAEWRWEVQYAADGSITGLWFEGEKLGDDLLLLKAMAPYVRAGSYLDMQGEDGEMWRWYFDGADCEELSAEVRFAAPSKGEIIDVEARGVTSGRITCSKEARSNVPKSGNPPALPLR